MPAFGKVVGMLQICLDMPLIRESTSCMACGEKAMRQWVCDIFELAPYSKRRCFMWGEEGSTPQCLANLGDLRFGPH